MMCACSKKEMPDEKVTGYLTLNINKDASLKADVAIEDFILRIINSQSVEILSEYIDDLPDQIVLPVGDYTVEAYSAIFSEPKFDTPHYSGKTDVTIVAGETTEASLICSQSNAGIKLVWSDAFSDLYSNYEAQITSGAGELTYSSTETRTGYFLPGTVSVSITADAQTINAGSITLAAKDMVTLTLQPKESTSGSLSINFTIDETVNNREIEIIIDPEYTDENSETNPYSVTQALLRPDETGIWVVGYIVGARGTSSWSTTSQTNIVIADVAGETELAKTMAIQLPTTGTLREELNIVDNPSHINKKILVKGNLVSYFGRGIQNVSSYSFVE